MRLKLVKVIATGRFKCTKCGYEFEHRTGPVKKCPIEKCLSIYVTWLNYHECLEYVYVNN